MKNLFTHPQETWDEAKCAKVAKSYHHDGLGTAESRPGRIAGSASVYPEYGQTQRWNGGFIAPDGEHYRAEHKPLPKVPEGWGFEQVTSWGTYLVRLAPCI